jgi:hypothetical protein
LLGLNLIVFRREINHLGLLLHHTLYLESALLSQSCAHCVQEKNQLASNWKSECFTQEKEKDQNARGWQLWSTSITNTRSQTILNPRPNAGCVHIISSSDMSQTNLHSYLFMINYLVWRYGIYNYLLVSNLSGLHHQRTGRRGHISK